MQRQRGTAINNSHSIKLARMLLTELLPARLPRQPEPAVMDATPSVDAFDREGEAGGALIAPYHFNAEAISRLLPADGLLLDLGSGSARLLAYLAKRRPDVRIVGLELSSPMCELGREHLRACGLLSRVRLLEGDMTRLPRLAEPPDVVSSVYALHHLRDETLLLRCATEIAGLQRRCGCGLWLFDHARPRTLATAETFAEIFSAEAPAAFRLDSTNSLCAAFAFDELAGALRAAGAVVDRARRSRLLPLFQAHWARPQLPRADGHARWQSKPMAGEARRQLRGLRRIMGRIP